MFNKSTKIKAHLVSNTTVKFDASLHIDENSNKWYDVHSPELFYPAVGLKLEELVGRLQIAYHLTTNRKLSSTLLSVSLFIVESCQFILESQQ
ncbi:unnamed protein product [Rotaria sp. Silwood2]|nr:unnamed protein product [Rotaria sp. Silwood2]